MDYAQLVKVYGAAPEDLKGRYSPAECLAIRVSSLLRAPDPKHVNTSYVERQNLTMRMDAQASVHAVANERVLKEG